MTQSTQSKHVHFLNVELTEHTHTKAFRSQPWKPRKPHLNDLSDEMCEKRWLAVLFNSASASTIRVARVSSDLLNVTFLTPDVYKTLQNASVTDTTNVRYVVLYIHYIHVRICYSFFPAEISRWLILLGFFFSGVPELAPQTLCVSL